MKYSNFFFLKIEAKNEEDVPDDLRCIICTQLYHYPYQLPCGHVFCVSCIYQWFVQRGCIGECPLDRLRYDATTRKELKKHKPTVEKIKNIIVNCPRKNKGCTQSYRYEGLGKHYSRCKNHRFR